MSIEKEKICHELKVLKRIEETEDTISLVLEVPRTTGGKFQYKAGQFITFFLTINGEEVRRSYSLASSPDCDSDFKVTVKLVPGGKGSTYLINNVKPGDKLWSTPPAGHFCLPPMFENQQFVFFAGGSGITPIISIIKSALKTSQTTRCILVYQNRTDRNIIFKSELAQLQSTYGDRLGIEHILSNPTEQWVGAKGRVDKNMVRDIFAKHLIGIRAKYYLCGPNGFMQSVDDVLKEFNVDKSNIIKESFSVSPTATPTQTATPAGSSTLEIDEDSVVIGDRTSQAKPETIEATIDGQTHKVTYKKDQTVLECLLDAGLNPPYSCLDGACMACIAKVETGLVYQNDMGILTEDNLEAKECLTCQARPASKYTKVNYEIF
jgi:ferredoxin-NADP reductase